MTVDAESASDDARAPVAAGVESQTFLHRHAPLLVALAAVAVAGGAFAAIPEARHAFSLTFHGNLSGLRAYIRSLNFGGAALLYALMLFHCVVFYPTELLTTTAGYIYGFLPGLAFAMFAWTCSAVLSYALGATIGRPVLHAVLGKRFVQLEKAMETGGTELMLTARLVPIVPFSLLGYAAGATRQSLWTLVWTSAVGYLPLTAAVTYLGSQAKSLSVNNPLIWVAVVVVVALVILSRFLTKRSQAHHQAATAEDAASRD